ncbi:hypothetical protein GWK47_052321 [Chionoecetes opilio]|uniref:Uncharacterized protein n=1 Tax=Chionoecetes opilio TaxID=41210 RepID=A0A8J4Y1S5_CHIOP|nr:hypothetical protein GWK47_052321 [Chionoecetes opilio]
MDSFLIILKLRNDYSGAPVITLSMSVFRPMLTSSSTMDGGINCKKVTPGLTEVGYQVVSVTTDGHRVNYGLPGKKLCVPRQAMFANPFMETRSKHRHGHKRPLFTCGKEWLRISCPAPP